METGTELSKTVATFIVQKILLDDAGLTYICATPERFYAVSSVLSTMVTKLLEAPSARLLKHIVRCYLRLSENSRAKDALRQCLPDALKDQTFAATLVTEDSVQKWLALLLKNVNEAGGSASAGSTTAVLSSQPVTVPNAALSSASTSSAPPPALTKQSGPSGLTFAEMKRDAWN
jgi:CCR4-NOT transcription complex subunit 9